MKKNIGVRLDQEIIDAIEKEKNSYKKKVVKESRKIFGCANS